MLLLAAALTPACEKNAVQEIAGPQVGGASIKFFNFAVGSPGVNFYANDTKVTAISSTSCAILTDANREQCTTTGAESTTGVNYGGAGNGANGWYSDIAPGQYTLTGRIASATDKDLAIANLQANLAAGKSYSYYLSGIYNTAAKTAESFIVEDPIPPADYTVAYVRFVHAMSNANPMTLYANDRTTLVEVPVGTEVTYKAAGAFTALPPGSYDLGTRYAGSTTNAISRVNVGIAAGRVYTITARGNITSSSTILLDNTANR
jgi:hypothetical protein